MHSNQTIENNGAKILIVEDESIVSMEIKHRVTNLGYTVCDVAVSGNRDRRRTGASGVVSVMARGDGSPTPAAVVVSRFGRQHRRELRQRSLRASE